MNAGHALAWMGGGAAAPGLPVIARRTTRSFGFRAAPAILAPARLLRIEQTHLCSSRTRLSMSNVSISTLLPPRPLR